MPEPLTLDGIRIRPFDGHDEMEQCVRLQRVTWGAEFDQIVPSAILWVAQRTGGIASGAFAPDGSLVGFVFGITGVEDGRLIHWSDMLAVHPDARGIGLGLALKRHQRAVLLDRGIAIVYWTFDPLEARNAHLNFRRLGVVARRYMRDVYGETGSHLHAGIGTDRLLAEWHIASPRVVRRIEQEGDAKPSRDANSSTSAPATPSPDEARIAVPLDIQSLKRGDAAAAVEQRSITRAAFEHYLGQGWTVTDTIRGDDALYYRLVPPGS